MSRLWLMLGRNGDVINALPLLKADADAGERPSLMTCRPYSQLLEGVSYADCVPFDGEVWELERAMTAARAISSDVKSLQVIGDTNAVKKFTYDPANLEHAKTDSFQKEVYRIADRMDLWKAQPPVVFDRRNRDRELALKQKVLPSKKKVILVALSGDSSPFPYRRTALELLRLKFKTGYAIVDISHVKADAFYDLLGLYESAHCLVASDSAPLHLAQACPNLPVVALTQDEPILWMGSAIRASHISYIRYGDFALRAVEMLDAIHGLKGGWKATTDKIIHAWSHYDLSSENFERHAQAMKTWDREYESGQWISRPTPIGGTGRDSNTLLKDAPRYPYLKDVIRIASLSASNDKTVICLTRADTCFDGRKVTDRLLNENLPVWAHRVVRDEGGDTFHPVCDLFAFTLGWWKAHQEECPELIMGMDPWWPRVFMALIKKGNGREFPGAIFRDPGVTPKVTGVIKYSARNEELHRIWQDKNGPIVLAPIVQDQIKTVIVNRHALLTAAYNPSIIRHDGKLLMAYRWHDNKDASTALAISEIDESGNVRNTKKVLVPRKGGSEEDPRLFMLNGELWMSYVDSTFPMMPPKCVMKLGKLKDGANWTLTDLQQPGYGQNDMTTTEKGWVFFQHEDNLACIYQSQPDQIIYHGENIHRSPSLRWKWGHVKGGTAPLPHDGKLLRFFHSTLDNEVPPNRRRYYLGAMLMEPNPPFKQIALSREPIVRGSEIDSLKQLERSGINHYKPKVIFPGGCIATKNGWLVSAGINDAMCGLLSIGDEDLKL